MYAVGTYVLFDCYIILILEILQYLTVQIYCNKAITWSNNGLKRAASLI